MDIDGRRGRKPLCQVLLEPGLQQPAQSPADDVHRWTIGATATSRREVIGRHTWLVSWSGRVLPTFARSGKNFRRVDANML